MCYVEIMEGKTHKLVYVINKTTRVLQRSRHIFHMLFCMLYTALVLNFSDCRCESIIAKIMAIHLTYSIKTKYFF
jgi:hypothetical protein